MPYTILTSNLARLYFIKFHFKLKTIHFCIVKVFFLTDIFIYIYQIV